MYETTTKTDRNEFVITQLKAGKSLREVQDLLIKFNYGKIDVSRIWKIWKKSGEYDARRAKDRYCDLCLEQRNNFSMYSVLRSGKVVGKICENCWDDRPRRNE